jgi:hypothetical protein
MRFLTIGLEFSHHVPMQRPQHTDPRQHGVAATPNPMDRRFTIVRLAPLGRRLAEQIGFVMVGST